VTTVGAPGDDAVALLRSDHFRTEAHLAHMGRERGLKLGSVESELFLEQVGRDTGQLTTLPGKDRASSCRSAPHRFRFTNPEAIERPHRVRKEG
jgi:hypothetical protein